MASSGMRKSISFLVLILLIFLSSLMGEWKELFSYTTENVVIVFMGGVRNTEVFDDSLHRYIPNIWEKIRPEGVLYENFYNMAFTGMGAGTFEAVTGVRRNENGRGASWHGLFPSIYEYYRKDRSVPQEKIWAVLSNDFDGNGINYSLHPAYGAPFAGSLWGNSNNSDKSTFEEAIRVMNQDQPSLISIHFRDPDRNAQHVNDPDLPDSIAWENYTNAIMVVDSLTNLIWTKINTDPAYAGKTALIIIAAHGRHIPPHGTFIWHGDACDGCRRLPFLAVGPDFKVGETISIRGDLIDLCPTIGELLDFDPVFAEGRVLEELFLDPPRNSHGKPVYDSNPVDAHLRSNQRRLSRAGAYSRNPFIKAIGDTLHVIWTERDTSFSLEAWTIMYRRSLDGGDSWDDPIPIINTIDPDDEVITVASLDGDSKGVGVMTASYSREQFNAGDSGWVWGSDFIVTLDGTEWQDHPNDYLSNKMMINFDNEPTISIHDSSCATAVLADRFNRFFSVSTDLGGSWLNFVLDDKPENEFTSPNTPSMVLDKYLYYVETMRYIPKSHLLVFRAQDAGQRLEYLTNIDDAGGDSFFPQLAYSDSVLYCIWSDDRNGHWEVYFSRSTDEGVSWKPNVMLSGSNMNTWYPSLETHNDTLLVVWEDYRDGASTLYKKVSRDGGLHWSDDIPEVTTPGISTFPKLSYSRGNYYLVWQDYMSGTWEVYFKEVDVDVPIGIDGNEFDGEGIVPRSLALFQNYPNPFNPQTEISFRIPGNEEKETRLRIYDMRGKLMKILSSGSCQPGIHRVIWDGTDQRNRDVSSGIYFYTLDVMGEQITKKMLLVR